MRDCKDGCEMCADLIALRDQLQKQVASLRRMNDHHSNDAHHLSGQLGYVRGMVRRLVHFSATTPGGVSWTKDPPPNADDLRRQEIEVRQFCISYLTDEVGNWPEMLLLMESVILLRRCAVTGTPVPDA